MKAAVPFENAVDLLDADHKAVKQMFIDYSALCEDPAPAEARRALAEKICQALTVHAKIEEEIFYPAVREAIGEHVLEEREEIFLKAQQAPIDLRGLAVPLYQRKKQLTAAVQKPSKPTKE